MALDLALVLLLSTGAYLVGSIPTAYLVARWARGTDIRQVGSKNVGALNAYHQAGLPAAALVLVVDAAKGALAALAPDWVGAPPWTVYFTTILAVSGHNWPVFLSFKGGRGVATALGISLVIVPLPTLIALAPTVLLVALTRNMIIGVGVGLVTVNVLAAVTGLSAGFVALCGSLSLLVTGTYIFGAWEQITTAIRTRRFRGIFYGTNFNP